MMRRATVLLTIVVALGATGCGKTEEARKNPKVVPGQITNKAGTASASQPVKKPSKDLGAQVTGAKDRAQKLADEENKRVEDVDKSMDQ